ncbi:MAG: hypothetical protein OEM02_14800 [Desulfobulbaceae bacterium]|nr:hypothetical protein [Desulfobulbaceae bacterium]
MSLFFNRPYIKEIITGIILFLFSFCIRITYQQETQVYLPETIVDLPFRSDVGKYFLAAYNLATHGNYSLESPNIAGTPPETTTDLSPGLPIFISFFFTENSSIESVFTSIQKAHAVLGSFTVLFTFILARLSIGFTGALIAGVLTAISPHLISMESYVLTETLYIFVLMLGSMLFTMGWLGNRPVLTGFSAIILACSSQVRTVSIFLIWIFLPLLVVFPKKRAINSLKTFSIHLISLVLGFVIVTAGYYQFKGYAITQDSWLRAYLSHGKEINSDSKVMKYETSNPYKKLHHQLSSIKDRSTSSTRIKYQSIWHPLLYLKLSVVPPKFYINDVRFTNKREAISYKRINRRLTKKSFSDYPLKYLTWNLWGKYLTFWNWDNIYVGDVFVYPMVKSGFVDNMFFKFIHKSMHALHLPLYWLSLCGVIIFFINWGRSTSIFPEQGLAVPVFGFLYFHGICTFIAWLPRYSIPVRPFSYILAAAMLTWTIKYLRHRPQRLSVSKNP